MHCWWDCKLEQLLWKTALEIPHEKKIQIKLSYDPSTSGIYPKKTKALIRKDICTSVFIIALFTIQDIEAAQVPTP